MTSTWGKEPNHFFNHSSPEQIANGRALAEIVPQGQADPQRPTPHPAVTKILLIEGNSGDAQLVRQILTEADASRFDLAHAKCLQEATEHLTQASFDVLLLDLSLPEEQELETLTRTRAAAPSLPIIVLTDSDEKTLAIKALKQGAQDYLVKDQMTSDGLERAIRYAIERQQTFLVLQRRIERERLVNEIAQHIRQSLSLDQILNTTVEDVRRFLEVDRVFIYRFQADWSGTAIAESVTDPWASVLGQTNQDHCFGQNYAPLYQQGRIQAVADVFAEGLSQCHIDFLAQFQVRANLVVPIVQGEVLWGLLVANQCEQPRAWQPLEVELLLRLSTQVAIAIQQSELYQQTQTELVERQRAEEQLKHNAFHDQLTDLPNRALYLNRLDKAIQRSKRQSKPKFALLFLDLDRFKLVNDSLGHRVGDDLLIAIARRLQTCLRPGDTIARLGGDEFAILLEDIENPGEATYIAERIHTSLSHPFKLDEQEIVISASIGITLGTSVFEQPEDLLRDADTAMYRAKAMGKARYAIFDPTMHDQTVARLQLETDLRRALERQEFQLYYQPLVHLKTGEVTGFEALIRWQHPERGWLAPDQFIPVAEETGLIIPIGAWVLWEACRQINLWQSITPEPLTVSVNLSPKQFSQPDLAAEVARIIQISGLEPQRIKLEITESLIIENPEAATSLLLQLQALGLQVHLDDFGTGYSSLNHLHRFPISTLKIDRSFVNNLELGSKNIEIVRTIIMLAHGLGMQVTAEGIETAEQLVHLQTLGCDYGQGYFFAKPLNREAASTLIAENSSLINNE